MKFTTPSACEELIYTLRLADFPRALNRSKINDLLDGFPPYSSDEVNANNIATNVAFPENGPVIAHDARRQLDNALLLPDQLFTVDVDFGPTWQKKEWSDRITKGINKAIKNSQSYDNMQKSVNSQNISHGIGPGVWEDGYRWRPKCRGIEDVLIPSDTLLDFDNLPIFAVFQKYTAFELWKATHGPLVDRGWNIPLADASIRWVDQQSKTLAASSWPDVWSPEKWQNRVKQDSGWYSSDAVPTIDTWHFYYLDDDDDKFGWRKKIILDAWGSPGPGGVGGESPKMSKIEGKYGTGKDEFAKTQFLYDSGKRTVADKLEQIIHFQIANCSSVAPFRYHAVRSLGFLLYAVCHLQNRLRCKLNDATFESLMQYYRVTNPADAERALRIDLTDKTPIPEGVQFVRPEERWKVDMNLPEFALSLNRGSLQESAASYTQDFDEGSANETATRTMAKVSNNQAMISGMVNQAYSNKKWMYLEICRRFCIKDSRDPEVRAFRANMLHNGVPEKALDVDRWDVSVTRVVGNGSKVIQMGMVTQVMSVYTKLTPTAQREALRLFLAVVTDDYELAARWTEATKRVSDSQHDAQVSASVMLNGEPLGLVEGVNHPEYVEALLLAMAMKVHEISQGDKMGTPSDLKGLQNLAGMTIDGQPLPGNGIQSHIAIIAQDEKQPHHKGQPADNSVKMMVKKYSDALKTLMNEVKAFSQRQAQAAQKAKEQQNGNGGIPPEAMAKIATTAMAAKAKLQAKKEADAQKMAHKEIQFQEGLKMKSQDHAVDLMRKVGDIALDAKSKRMKISRE